MFFFLLQSLLLLAIAYILGCVIGCFARTYLWSGANGEPKTPSRIDRNATVRPPLKGEPMPVAAAAEPVAFKAAEPAPVAPPAPKPVPVAKAAPKKTAPKKVTAAPAGAKDDLKRIRGIGRQNEARLNAIGVSTFAQIAAWSKAEQAEIGERLAFPGRIEREEWVKQAKVLAKGGETDFSKRVAKGEIETSTGKGTTGDMGKKPRVLKQARKGGPDNLTLIDGVGNAIEKRLFEIGIFHFDQIAKLSAEEQVWVGIAVGFPGRVERENWVEEARILAEGGMTDHARRVEEGKITTSRKSTDAEKKS